MAERHSGVYEPPAHLATRRVDWFTVLKCDPCPFCPSKPWRTPRPMTLDHVQPRALGGSNGVENLVGMCEACNEEKGDRSLLIFLLERSGAEKSAPVATPSRDCPRRV